MTSIKKYCLTIFLIFTISLIKAQDTITYIGKLDVMLYESIELYPDSTFKWTSEYDLSWSEYGFYSINDGILKLDFYINFSDKSSELEPDKIKKYQLVNDKMYLLDSKGKVIKKIQDKSFRTKRSWFRNGQHKYTFYKVN